MAKVLIGKVKGDKGDPGYTPQKGVDYWTAEEVAEIQTATENANTAADSANTAANRANTAAELAETNSFAAETATVSANEAADNANTAANNANIAASSANTATANATTATANAETATTAANEAAQHAESVATDVEQRTDTAIENVDVAIANAESATTAANEAAVKANDAALIIDDTTTATDKAWSSIKISSDLEDKVDKEDGKGLSENNLTNTLLENINKVLGTENVNVNPLQILSGLLTGNLDDLVTGEIATDTDFSTLENGIYTISTEVRQRHADFRPTNNASPPSGVTYYNHPGGLIFIMDTPTLDNWVSVGIYTNGTQTGMNYGSSKHPMKLMIFLDSDGVLAYRTSTVNSLKVNVTSSSSGSTSATTPVYTASKWRYFHWDLTPQYIKKGIWTLTEDTTATTDSPLTVTTLSGPIAYPYTTGYVIGPVCAKLTLTTSGTSSVFKVTSGTFPAGTYYYEIE